MKNDLMKKSKILLLGILVVSALCAAAAVTAKENTKVHDKITDPKVYIPLREEMTAMEMKFVDIQILAASDKIDYKAIQKGLEEMEASSKKIRAINPKETLREPLEKLTSQLSGLQRSARKKDKETLKANLDGLFETCFKCHQSHAPMM